MLLDEFTNTTNVIRAVTNANAEAQKRTGGAGGAGGSTTVQSTQGNLGILSGGTDMGPGGVEPDYKFRRKLTRDEELKLKTYPELKARWDKLPDNDKDGFAGTSSNPGKYSEKVRRYIMNYGKTGSSGGAWDKESKATDGSIIGGALGNPFRIGRRKKKTDTSKYDFGDALGTPLPGTPGAGQAPVNTATQVPSGYPAHASGALPVPVPDKQPAPSGYPAHASGNLPVPVPDKQPAPSGYPAHASGNLPAPAGARETDPNALTAKAEFMAKIDAERERAYEDALVQLDDLKVEQGEREKIAAAAAAAHAAWVIKQNKIADDKLIELNRKYAIQKAIDDYKFGVGSPHYEPDPGPDSDHTLPPPKAHDHETVHGPDQKPIPEPIQVIPSDTTGMAGKGDAPDKEKPIQQVIPSDTTGMAGTGDAPDQAKPIQVLPDPLDAKAEHMEWVDKARGDALLQLQDHMDEQLARQEADRVAAAIADALMQIDDLTVEQRNRLIELEIQKAIDNFKQGQPHSDADDSELDNLPISMADVPDSDADDDEPVGGRTDPEGGPIPVDEPIAPLENRRRADAIKALMQQGIPRDLATKLAEQAIASGIETEAFIEQQIERYNNIFKVREELKIDPPTPGDTKDNFMKAYDKTIAENGLPNSENLIRDSYTIGEDGIFVQTTPYGPDSENPNPYLQERIDERIQKLNAMIAQNPNPQSDKDWQALIVKYGIWVVAAGITALAIWTAPVWVTAILGALGLAGAAGAAQEPQGRTDREGGDIITDTPRNNFGYDYGKMTLADIDKEIARVNADMRTPGITAAMRKLLEDRLVVLKGYRKQKLRDKRSNESLDKVSRFRQLRG